MELMNIYIISHAIIKYEYCINMFDKFDHIII